MDLSDCTKARLWKTYSNVSALNSNCFLLPLNLNVKFVSDLSFLTRDGEDLA